MKHKQANAVPENKAIDKNNTRYHRSNINTVVDHGHTMSVLGLMLQHSVEQGDTHYGFMPGHPGNWPFISVNVPNIEKLLV